MGKKEIIKMYAKEFEKYFDLRLADFIHKGSFNVRKFCYQINQTQLPCKRFVEKKYGIEASLLIDALITGEPLLGDNLQTAKKTEID